LSCCWFIFYLEQATTTTTIQPSTLARLFNHAKDCKINGPKGCQQQQVQQKRQQAANSTQQLWLTSAGQKAEPINDNGIKYTLNATDNN